MLLLSVLLTTWVVLCQAVQQSTSSAERPLAESHNQFAGALYRQLTKKAGNKQNVIFSPTSIATALTMTYTGARGRTATQMAEVLQLGSASLEAIQSASLAMLDALLDGGHSYNLSIANRLFGRKGYNFSERFINDADQYFRASLKALDFQHDAAGSRDFINNWVEEMTQNKIKDLIPAGGIDMNTVLILVNAIYFKGAWSAPFDTKLTKQAPFHVDTDTIRNVDMMSQVKRFKYGEIPELNCHALELPYGGSQTAMIILLPDEDHQLCDIQANMSLSSVINIVGSFSNTEVTVMVPKFKITQDVRLKGLLYEMGMKDLFSIKDADLSGMNGQRDLYVSEAVHKAYIDVNEEGTEAAGATQVSISLKSAHVTERPKFIADRPFIYAIIDKATGSVLFLGHFADPQSSLVIGTFGALTGDPISSANGPHSLGVFVACLAALVAAVVFAH